jgi:hypothetical protein
MNASSLAFSLCLSVCLSLSLFLSLSPQFDMLIRFLRRAESFMDQSPQNVIAIHCKGGKGRTGVFVCAWLRYSLFRENSKDAMDYFASRRSGRKAKHTQGVTGASQRRYLEYLDKAITMGGFRANELFLVKVRVHTCPHMQSDGTCNPWVIAEIVLP